MRRVELLSNVASKGDYLHGIDDIRKSGKKLYGNTNRFLYWFDQGVLFHYAGEYDSSRVYFAMAEQVLDELYARSVANEAASILTNDNVRPYRGRRYEQILLHQFLSFDYLAVDEYDESLVETRKVQLVFERFQSKDRGKDKYNDEGMSHYISSIVYDGQGERDNATISLYKAVQAYQAGPFPLPPEVAALAFRRLKSDSREADIEQLGLLPPAPPESTPDREHSGTEIILVGLAGQGPVLGEKMFWGTYVVGGVLTAYYQDPNGDTAFLILPAPPLPASEVRNIEDGHKTRAGTTYHIKFALPEMVMRPSRTRDFSVEVPSASRTARSFVLTDTDRLLEQDMADNRAVTVARTAVRVVLRTIAAQKAKERMTSDVPVLNLLVSLGTDIAADQLEKADTRLCFLLPRTIQIARVPVPPGTHTVKALARGSNGAVLDSRLWEGVTVRKGQKKFLFYPCLK